MNQSLHTFLASHGIGGCPGTLILAVDLKPRALRADYFYHQGGFLPATIRGEICVTTDVDAGQSPMFSPDVLWHVVVRTIESQVHGELCRRADRLGGPEVKAVLHSRPPLRFVTAAVGRDPLFDFATSCRDADLASLTTWARDVRCAELKARLASFSAWRASFSPVISIEEEESGPLSGAVER